MLRYINTRQAIREAGALLVNKLRSQMNEDDTYATGKISNSIFNINSQKETTVYANWKIKYVDEGAGPSGTIPYNAIKAWAKAKGLVPKKIRGKKTSFNRMAWLIAKSVAAKGTIQRFGYKGSGLINFVLKQYGEEIKENITSAYKRDLDAYLKEVTSKIGTNK